MSLGRWANLIGEPCSPIPHHGSFPQEELEGIVRPMADLDGGDEVPLGLLPRALHLLPAKHLGPQELGAAGQTSFSYHACQVVELVAKEERQPLGRQVATPLSLRVDGIRVLLIVLHNRHILPLETRIGHQRSPARVFFKLVQWDRLVPNVCILFFRQVVPGASSWALWASSRAVTLERFHFPVLLQQRNCLGSTSFDVCRTSNSLWLWSASGGRLCCRCLIICA